MSLNNDGLAKGVRLSMSDNYKVEHNGGKEMTISVNCQKLMSSSPLEFVLLSIAQ